MQIAFKAAVSGGAGRFELDVLIETPRNRLVLFGPSGSGKSLTLLALAGLFRPQSGRVEVGGRVLFDSQAGIDVSARSRRIGFLFQDYALFPHLTVRQNILFGLGRLWRRPAPAARRRAGDLMDLFDLAGLADSMPSELSGGQKQRAALARALAPEPELLLLDEPFSALDQPLRLRLRSELKQTLDRLRMPMVMVTHDPEEAAMFGEAVAVMECGRVSSLRGADEVEAFLDPSSSLVNGLFSRPSG